MRSSNPLFLPTVFAASPSLVRNLLSPTYHAPFMLVSPSAKPLKSVSVESVVAITRHQLQIFNPIIVNDAVLVVDNFPWLKKPP